MTKKEFVQRAAIQFLDNESPCVDRAISWAERLWQRLTERGYGPAKEQGPRQHVDWYSLLSDQQRGWFDEFWANFHRDGSIKRGKQKAAMRWGQINPDEQLARQIIDAAGQEADRKLPEGQSRKMPEGWLNERRFEDFTPTHEEEARRGADERAGEIRRLRSEAAHLKQMIDRERNPETAEQLHQQLEDLRGRLAVLETEADG